MSVPVTVYTSADLAETWKREAKNRQMSMSSFAEFMIEAGRKQISLEFQVDNDAVELRQQRNELKRENKELQGQLKRLRSKALKDERGFIIEFVQNSPGVTYRTIVEEFIDTTPSRVNYYLDVLTDEEITKVGDQYYPADSSQRSGL